MPFDTPHQATTKSDKPAAIVYDIHDKHLSQLPSHQEEHRSLFNRIFDRERTNLMSDNHRVTEEGSIKRLEMPKNWQQAMPNISDSKAMIGAPMMTEYNPSGDLATKMCYWNRAFGGAKENPETAAAFNRVLSREPHQLNQQELKSLQHLIGNGVYANTDAFEILHAETRKIHGRTVLAVESVYKDNQSQPQGRRSYGVFINSDGSGRYVEQVYFTAPEQAYKTNLKEAVDCINSIKWHKDSIAPI
ncbi:hypothetical protein KBI23_20950 [bacterium]|nr:hypothetical protein [bacterium]MBP9807691.1 hypothetical protein [bacterium]